MFWAERGRGAFLNDRRLRVAARTRFEEAVFATGIPFMGHGQHGRFLKELHQISQRVSGVRRFGAAALDLAWVAAGRFDGFWERDLSPWDIAAGILLVTEAGGRVTDADGGGRSPGDRLDLRGERGLARGAAGAPEGGGIGSLLPPLMGRKVTTPPPPRPLRSHASMPSVAG